MEARKYNIRLYMKTSWNDRLSLRHNKFKFHTIPGSDPLLNQHVLFSLAAALRGPYLYPYEKLTLLYWLKVDELERKVKPQRSEEWQSEINSFSITKKAVSLKKAEEADVQGERASIPESKQTSVKPKKLKIVKVIPTGVSVRTEGAGLKGYRARSIWSPMERDITLNQAGSSKGLVLAAEPGSQPESHFVDTAVGSLSSRKRKDRHRPKSPVKPKRGQVSILSASSGVGQSIPAEGYMSMHGNPYTKK